jgi:hypothetical protein
MFYFLNFILNDKKIIKLKKYQNISKYDSIAISNTFKCLIRKKKKKTLFIIFFILIFKIEWWVWRIQQAVTSLPK